MFHLTKSTFFIINIHSCPRGNLPLQARSPSVQVGILCRVNKMPDGMHASCAASFSRLRHGEGAAGTRRRMEGFNQRAAKMLNNDVSLPTRSFTNFRQLQKLLRISDRVKKKMQFPQNKGKEDPFGV